MNKIYENLEMAMNNLEKCKASPESIAAAMWLELAMNKLKEKFPELKEEY